MSLHAGTGRGPGHLNRNTTGATAVASTGSPIGLTVLDSTAITTSPTNNIDGNGWIAAVTFKGLSIGQTLDPTKISFTVTEPGFDNTGAASTVTRTVTGVHFVRKPLYGVPWITATSFNVNDFVWNKTGGANTTRIYKCIAKGGGASSNAPVVTSGTSGVLADGYNWQWISNTSATDNPPQTAIEATANAGADAVVYVALDKYVSSSATITAVNIQAGAYTGSIASNNALVTKTNISTFTPFKPHVEWVMQPWQVFGATLHCEAYADHPFGANGSMLAAGKFTVYDNTGVTTGLTATVTQGTGTTVGTTTNGNYAEVFAADIDISSLTNGSLYSVRFQAYPNIGAVWDSDTDGFGSATSGWTTSTKMTANTSKRIPFTKDSSAFAINYAVVDGVGGAPAVSTTLATARTTPYASIKAAADALQTANSSKLNYKTICYIKGGTTLTGFGGDLTTKTYDTTWFLIARDPGDATVAQINPDTVTAANRKAGGRIKFEDISLVTTVATPVIDSIALSTVGDFQYESWFNRCVLTGKTDGTQQPMTRAGLFSITNSVLTSIANMQGGTRSAWKLSLCNTVQGSGTDTPQMNAVHQIGDKMLAKAVPGTAIVTTNWNENGALLDVQIYAFCTWFNCTNNVIAFGVLTTTGGSWTCNLIESNLASAKGGQLSGDGVIVTPGRIYNMFNTFAGDGQNFVYNESGTAQVKKVGVARLNAGPDRNCKQDWYDQSAASNANRTGSFAARYGVDWYRNGIYAATSATPGPANLAGEVLETGSFLTGTASWTSDRSKLGTGAGNGDYRPTTASSFKSMVSAADQCFVKDLNGTTRKTDGTGACGAYEWA